MFQLTYMLCVYCWGKIVKVNGINSVNVLQKNNFLTNRNSRKNYFLRAQNNEISNVFYKPVSFGRTWVEHKSWGAVVDPKTKETSFKILTYPDTKKVEVTVEKRNNKNQKKTYQLKNMGNGIFATDKKIPAGEVSNGDKYYYTLYKGNGEIAKVKDPYSFRQEDLLGSSTVYDHSLYEWKDDDWYKNNKNRISRLANKNNRLSSVDSARIYEFNTASLTKKGTFDSAKMLIRTLPQLGFNAIEIMPVENTYSFNWGYDGVDKMAPSEHLGGPDSLKSLIDFAHEQGLNVIMDMVPNHLGPDGAMLLKTGPYIKGSNCFGEAFNYEGKNSRYVRDYIVNAAMNWIDNYHCDGLRLDMTKFMDSDYTMKQIAAEINYHKPDIFLIAEDGRSSISVDDNANFWDDNNEPHDKRVVNPLKPFETGAGQSEKVHCGAIENISNCNTSIGRLGYDSEWDFNYYHSLKDGLYGVIDLDRFEKACYCSQDRVKYVMSHDEIGNFEGSRLLSKLLVPMLHLNDHIILNDEDKERALALKEKNGTSIEDATRTVTLQKAQLVAEKLAIMLQTGQLDKYITKGIFNKRWVQVIEQAFRQDVLEANGINKNSGITYDSIKMAFTRSMDKNKMALARTYSIPGPKMIFQGDDRADLTPFRFFREFESVRNEDYLYIEKGYQPGRAALQESTLGNIKYSQNGKILMTKYRNLVRDLNHINEENSALKSGVLIPENTVKHQASQVLATHAKDFDNQNEIFSITNFNDSDYPRYNAAEYYISFPEGEWKEILNTDDKKYGGTGNFINSNTIKSDGLSNVPIKLAGESTILFKRIA